MHYLRTLTYLWSLLTLLLMVAITTICSCVSTPQRSGQLKEQDEYDVAAYIWPSCHNDPRGRDTLWSEGIGEWEVIQKGTPRFEGHYQPKVPLWGYEMDDDTQVMENGLMWQLRMASICLFSIGIGMMGSLFGKHRQ